MNPSSEFKAEPARKAASASVTAFFLSEAQAGMIVGE
jgi:hypothetical protein